MIFLCDLEEDEDEDMQKLDTCFKKILCELGSNFDITFRIPSILFVHFFWKILT